MKPFVIIESPYAGEVKRNEAYAKRCMKDSLDRGEVPFVSHLLYTMVLDDTKPEDRKLGMEAGWELIRHSHFTAVYEDYGLSKGMDEGIARAVKLGHKIERRSIGKNE